MTPNVNPDSGIAYGYISAASLDPDIVETLLYGSHARDLSYVEGLQEFLTELRADIDNGDFVPERLLDGNGALDEDAATEEFGDEWECDSAITAGEIEIEGYPPNPVQYQSSWMGGALHFFILMSPFSTDKARRASPCVPNAGIIDTCDGDVTAYDVPADWRYQE
jgi:hypothetical protein